MILIKSSEHFLANTTTDDLDRPNVPTERLSLATLMAKLNLHLHTTLKLGAAEAVSQVLTSSQSELENNPCHAKTRGIQQQSL